MRRSCRYRFAQSPAGRALAVRAEWRPRLHGRRLDKFKLGHSFEQAFVQGEFGKHGCYLDEKQKYSCIA
ncbi:hypothetical protein ALO35_102919 [Pseudomonas amygdali pv. lachrymans]|uniref:Uncharacterized protein n=1 Tax=Pseudomonas amygdali pv. lachrymans TaxID=53707 RepID=A0A0P9TN79_PSEAV|nr:hypothetical protein ALO35_102919 [Pseudomonas amygdali pv. lachrymans]